MKPSYYRIRYEKELNDAQLRAVMFDAGPLLVIAGAGSGKTRTLTYRVARLVEDGVPPSAVLLLTFTRKASAEMLNRASRLLDHRCGQVAGGTFHSFANAVLRRYAGAIGLDSDFSILDRADSESLIGMAKKDLGLTANKRKLPRNQTLANIFSRAINKSVSVADVLYADYPHFTVELEPILDLFDAYQDRKIQHHFLDYDDLLVYAHRLLENHEEIRDRIAAGYQYVMVDEYQDTNLLQADILRLLAGRNQNVMAVGDDSQSIYAFRGANFKNIIEFPRFFPGAEIIRLEENYRSIQPILDLTNAVIAQAAEKYEKHLFTRRQGGTRPMLVDTGSENNQSCLIVDHIRELQRRQVPLNDIAVLFRAGFHSFDLEIELTREQIPFVKFGGFKFMEASHIKDLLAHLRVLVNPRDRLSWFRLLMLLENVGPKTAANIYAGLVSRQSAAVGIAAALNRVKNSGALEKLKELYSRLEDPDMGIVEMGEAVMAYYQPILVRRYDDYPKRQKDLEQLLAIMNRYKELKNFLMDMALEPPSASVEGELSASETDGGRLVLSTIHSAKGLEWHTVFILWAVDGRFPSVHSLDNPDELEEELRLMYVAATRAKENLFITYPSRVYDRGSGLFLGRASRFLDGLPEEILEKQTLAW